MKNKILLSHYLMALIPIFLYIFFILAPILWTFLVSFKEVRSIDLRNAELWNLPGNFAGIHNYTKILKDALFWKALRNTFYYAILYIPFTIAFALLLASLLKKRRRHSFLSSTFFMPYVISVISVAIVFQTLFRSETGLVNTVLNWLNIHQPSWFAHGNLAMIVIALVGTWRKVGYYMLIYLAGLQGIPPSLYEAASIDGASYWQKFYYITLPLLRKISFVVFVLLLADSMRVFQEILILTGGGPDNTTLTFSFLIYNEAFQFRRIGSAAAMSYLLFLLTILILWLPKILQNIKRRQK